MIRLQATGAVTDQGVTGCCCKCLFCLKRQFFVERFVWRPKTKRGDDEQHPQYCSTAGAGPESGKEGMEKAAYARRMEPDNKS